MKNVVKIPTNEILESGVYYSGMSESNNMKNIITQNILHDYSDGIRQVVVSVIPTNYYLVQTTTKKLDWQLGQIIQIGDAICFTVKPTSQNHWIPYMFYKQTNPNSVLAIWFEVVDRRVRYEGQIIIDLVLQELKELNY